MERHEEPRYVISVAARILGTHTYTLRYYERIGLIGPKRSQGNIRLYSDRDIDLLRRVKTLVEDMGGEPGRRGGHPAPGTADGRDAERNGEVGIRGKKAGR